jgi:hypothetical protein
MYFKPIVLMAMLVISGVASAQSIPKEIWGKWIIQRELSTRTISCWGAADAKKLIGTQIEYSDKIFRWDHITTNDPKAEVRAVTAEQFSTENSSPSSSGSQVDFHQLGIVAAQTKEISIQHKPANISRATSEIPGDSVLVKDPNSIVFAVCNVYFEAKRLQDER